MAVMAKKSKKAKSGVEPSPEAALGDIDATVEAEVEVKPEEQDVKKKKKKKSKVSNDEEGVMEVSTIEPQSEVAPDISSGEPPAKKKKKKSKDKTAEKSEVIEEKVEEEQLHEEVEVKEDAKIEDSGKTKGKGKVSVVNSAKHRLKVYSSQAIITPLILQSFRMTSIIYQTSSPSCTYRNTDWQETTKKRRRKTARCLKRPENVCFW